ncbi:MAG: PPK2 family polyphosphate kinase [Beijerinckiaceae bacterium]|jgi:PPK2 family polyphosphate:nucleotide phosphotransferase
MGEERGKNGPPPPDLAAAAARLDRCRITSGKGFKLANCGPSDIHPAALEETAAVALLRDRITRISALQERLYISKAAAILVVVQGMDCGGKDSTIKHVTEGIHPQGLTVMSFKTPTPDEYTHDFLWRISRALPALGMIGVFNRSHYESVLVTRVHPEILGQEGFPKSLLDKAGFWDKRLEDIAAFEHHLAREGTRIVKIFLNITFEEQKKRLLERLNDPLKNWKFDPSDVKEREFWPAYMEAYDAAIAATATSHAPWFVVPANHRWYARLVVAEAILAAFDGLDLERPALSEAEISAIDAARRALEG